MATTVDADRGWRSVLPAGVRPYTEAAPFAAFFLGISSGFPYAMIGATLTTRLKQDGIDKSTITAFTLVFLAYNFKFLWAWIMDGVRIPVLGRLGQRVSWMLVTGAAVIAAVINLALADPANGIGSVVTAAILVGIAGASFDIVIDAYRIETLEPRQLGVGSGMSQYGWRIGSAGAGALALVVAARADWSTAYLACAALALPAMLTALVMGEPKRHREPTQKKGIARTIESVWKPFAEFFMRKGALLVLLFILLHKIGDTLANLTFRLLFDDLGFSNDEIAIYDVGVGFWAYLIGIFIGGILYAQLGLKRSVMISLILMAVSNFSFAMLAVRGPQQFRNGRRDRVREYRQRHRRRLRRRLLLGAVRPQIHRGAICADFGGGEHRRPLPDRHDRRRAHRRHGLCELLPADHRGSRPGHHPVLDHDAHRAGRSVDGHCRRGRERRRKSEASRRGTPEGA